MRVNYSLQRNFTPQKKASFLRVFKVKVELPTTRCAHCIFWQKKRPSEIAVVLSASRRRGYIYVCSDWLDRVFGAKFPTADPDSMGK